MSNYLKLVNQAMSVRFEFRKARRQESEDSESDPLGSVNVILNVGKEYDPTSKRESFHKYGPYATSIKTTQQIWESRYVKRLSGPAKLQLNELNRELADVQNQLETIHVKLEQKINEEQSNLFIDGPMIIEAWKSDKSFRPTTLAEVYDEFMDYKLSMIQDNRSKRKPEQISTSTYNTYPKRWVLIQQFLLKRGEGKIPVGNIRFKTATDLKEWMVKQQGRNGEVYELVTVSKVIKLLKMLLTYAQQKGHVKYNVLATFSMPTGSVADPKPLTAEQMHQLETADLPPVLRHQCDSWLIAAELCLHYSDFLELRSMKFITSESGTQFIEHQRVKQTGASLKQTVNLTPRAIRLLEKYNGVKGLCYSSNAYYSKQLKQIAKRADLRDLTTGEIMPLQFGQGRDTGLTQRAIDGATSFQLSKIAGWSKPEHAERYVGNAMAIVEGFSNTMKLKPEPSNPFIHTYKAS